MTHRKHPEPADRSPATDDKTCTSCGRRIKWRRKWAANWDEIRYCSDACRRRGVTAVDEQLEVDILASLPATVGNDEPLRRAARRLVAKGKVELVQNGHAVDPSSAKGPFQVRKL